MHAMTDMLARGYAFGAPSREAEEIDAQIAERQRCPGCGSPMHYEGYHRSGYGYREYIALAVCSRCGREISF